MMDVQNVAKRDLHGRSSCSVHASKLVRSILPRLLYRQIILNDKLINYPELGYSNTDNPMFVQTSFLDYENIKKKKKWKMMLFIFTVKTENNSNNKNYVCTDFSLHLQFLGKKKLIKCFQVTSLVQPSSEYKKNPPRKHCTKCTQIQTFVPI